MVDGESFSMRKRVDVIMVERGLAPSREKAQALLMAGQVYVEGQRVDKPGTPIDDAKEVEVRGAALPFVSRGGLKLEKALDFLGWDVTGERALDIGASTGGFTDCLLQRGARQVVALDVGYGQLDWKLRQDPRVVLREKTNARHLSPEQLGEPVSFVSIDVAFISLALIFPVLPPLLVPPARVVSLVKPQFEAGRKQVRKGVVDDPEVHREVLVRVLGEAGSHGLELVGLTFSPVRGPAGNLEYLAGFRAIGSKPAEVPLEVIAAVVTAAHEGLPRGTA